MNRPVGQVAKNPTTAPDRACDIQILILALAFSLLVISVLLSMGLNAEANYVLSQRLEHSNNNRQMTKASLEVLRLMKCNWLLSSWMPVHWRFLFANLRSYLGDDDYLICVETNPGEVSILFIFDRCYCFVGPVSLSQWEMEFQASRLEHLLPDGPLLKVFYTHCRISDSDFLVGIEDNPGPAQGKGPPQNNQGQKGKGGRQNQNQNQIAKQKLADLEKANADLIKKLEARDAPVSIVRDEIALMTAEQDKLRTERDNEFEENSYTFPTLKTPIISAVLPSDGGELQGTIHIAHLPETAVKGFTVVRWWAVRLLLGCIGIVYSSLIFHAATLETPLLNQTFYTWSGYLTIPFAMLLPIFAWLVNTIKLTQYVRLIGIPVKRETLLTDDRPDFDRGESLGPQEFTDIQLYVELCSADGRFYYFNRKCDLVLPSFWFINNFMDNRALLRTLNVNMSQLTDAVNRKTLEIPKVSRYAQRVDRASRMVAANPKYQENYKRKLETGDSSHEDLLLLACVMLTRDAMVNPMDF